MSQNYENSPYPNNYPNSNRNDRNDRNERNSRNDRPEENDIPVDIEKINSTNDEEANELIQPVESFEDLNLDDKILRGIYGYGFENPSPIQQRAIKPFLAGRDIIAQAQSGMGKTATFCLGVLGRLDPSKSETQALVLAHTRELALQINMVFRAIGHYLDIHYNLSVKGVPIHENIESLNGKNRTPHIVIGTPGRILDMIHKGALQIGTLKMLVLDEADEMLSKGFLDQIYDIFKSLPSNIQVGLYSATMNEEFFKITNNFMRKPVNVLVKADLLTLEGIKQYYINVEKNDFKFETLCDIFSLLTVSQSMIYCNSKKVVDDLTYRLQEANFTVSYIHGAMTSNERELTMAAFRSGKTRVLVSTDLLSRGIDVQQVSVVINYDVPTRVDSYLHRIGRSGRFGRKGVAINFATYYDIKKIKNIEQFYNTQIDILPEDISGLLSF
mgnify:CR=1 FL=1|tara:strand:- start:1241 stop:2566 length:1326 start_codon:yes stop_codon:yes gene_type:complete